MLVGVQGMVTPLLGPLVLIYWLVAVAPRPRDSLLRLLRERYARGEIHEEEYELRRSRLIR